MMRIGSRRLLATEIRIVQVVTQLTDGQRREMYLSPIMHIGFLACFHAISLERNRFSEIATLLFLPL